LKSVVLSDPSTPAWHALSMLLLQRGKHLESIESVKNKPRITVLGIGNILLQDEGIGVHLIQELAGELHNIDVDLIDGGTSPDIPYLVSEDTDKLIIIDAIDAGDEPGAIYKFTPEDIEQDKASPISLHEIGVLQSLRLMSLENRKPKSTVIIGIQPKTIDYGMELSTDIKKKLPEVIKLVLKEIEETKTATEVLI